MSKKGHEWIGMWIWRVSIKIIRPEHCISCRATRDPHTKVMGPTDKVQHYIPNAPPPLPPITLTLRITPEIICRGEPAENDLRIRRVFGDIEGEVEGDLVSVDVEADGMRIGADG